MDWLPPGRYAAELDAETTRFTAAVLAQPDDRVVPACPKWTVRDLVTHVGAGHRYATRILQAGQMLPYEVTPAPADRLAWPSWLGDGARDLGTAVRATGFHRPAP